MSPEELQKWLSEHSDEIFQFMDYEPTIDSEEELAVTLGYWFAGDSWKSAGYRFVHLGIDGTGSQIAAWIRPGSPVIPVVLFGSEGGAGVLARSCEDWAKCVAHAPFIDEYPEDGEARMSMIEEDDEDDEAIAARHSYKNAVEARLGTLPPLEVLIADLEDLDSEFVSWVESLVG